MIKNTLRKKLLAGEMSPGGWMQIGHPACAEIFARAGFEWVCVDLEHGAIGIETMTDIFRTLDAFGCVPVARIPINDPVWIHRSLDAGARGLIVPMIKTAAEAGQAVSEAKYPPRGVRGYGYSRANMHGMDFAEYIASANDEIAVIAQIEHKDAIANLEDILAVDGIDGAFIGPLDLSGSMGLTGQMDHPDVKAALARFLKVCAEKGITPGMHVVRPRADAIADSVRQGYRMLALGLDNVMLDIGATEALKAARNVKL